MLAQGRTESWVARVEYPYRASRRGTRAGGRPTMSGLSLRRGEGADRSAGRPWFAVAVIAGYLFHLGLFALLFFAAPHVLFLEEHLLGFGWTPMPHWAFIVASQFAFFGLLILWLRRMLNSVSRLISTLDDHVAAILTFVVMLTGCLALLQGFTELRLLHRFTVELLLIYFPFSCLMHTFTFIPSRAFTGAWFGRRGIDA